MSVSPGEVSKLKIDQKLMTNTLNHFSDVRKHVMAAEIRLMFLKTFFAQTQKRGKRLSLARGDQICEVLHRAQT